MKKGLKTTLLSLSTILATGTIVATFIVKCTFPYKSSIYFFSSYVDGNTKTEINKKYNYKEYKSTEDFEYAIANNKAIAGVSSDYIIINMINQGAIAPISYLFNDIFGIKDNIQDYYIDSVNDQLSFFDQFIDENTQQSLKEKYGHFYNEKKDKFQFSDFVIPYFINDRVYAYDWTKFGLNKENSQINVKDYSVKGILKSLFSPQNNKNNNTKMNWTKNELENTIFGQEFYSDNFDTIVNEDNYQKYIDGFSKIVEEGTNLPMNNASKNIFESDSDVVLNNLISPQSDFNAAVLYNGDALDAYYAHDNFTQIPEDLNPIRIIRSKNNIRILDAFVVSSGINENEKKQLLNDLNPIVFNGMFFSNEEIEEYEDPYKIPGIFQIFNFVNYTPCTKGIYNYTLKNYFIDENTNEVDEIAQQIFQVDDKAKPIHPINKNVTSSLRSAFQKKLNPN